MAQILPPFRIEPLNNSNKKKRKQKGLVWSTWPSSFGFGFGFGFHSYHDLFVGWKKSVSYKFPLE